MAQGIWNEILHDIRGRTKTADTGLHGNITDICLPRHRNPSDISEIFRAEHGMRSGVHISRGCGFLDRSIWRFGGRYFTHIHAYGLFDPSTDPST